MIEMKKIPKASYERWKNSGIFTAVDGQFHESIVEDLDNTLSVVANFTSDNEQRKWYAQFLVPEIVRIYHMISKRISENKQNIPYNIVSFWSNQSYFTVDAPKNKGWKDMTDMFKDIPDNIKTNLKIFRKELLKSIFEKHNISIQNISVLEVLNKDSLLQEATSE